MTTITKSQVDSLELEFKNLISNPNNIEASKVLEFILLSCSNIEFDYNKRIKLISNQKNENNNINWNIKLFDNSGLSSYSLKNIKSEEIFNAYFTKTGKLKLLQFKNDSLSELGFKNNNYSIKFYESGELKSIEILGANIQKCQAFYKSGNVKCRYQIRDMANSFVGEYLEFFPTGKKRIVGNYDMESSNSKIGKWIEYYSDGKIKSIEEYALDQSGFSLKIGTHKFFDEKGKKILKEKYNKGELIKSVKY